MANKPNPYKSYLQYSNLALQLFLSIGIAGWLGFKLDGYLGLKFPVFMISFGFIAFGGMMYQVYKSITRE